jgi:hypothetical protein
MFFRRNKKGSTPAPSRAEVLRARPLRNPVLTWGPDNQGDLVIHIPLEKKPWMAKLGRFLPAPEKRHIVLDDIGADVWQMCDGENSVEAIRKHITSKYQMNHKEAEASLLEHLRQLARRKLIVAVAGPEDEPDDAPPKPENALRRHRRKKK